MEIYTQHAIEVLERNRFEFGKNWAKFLGLLNDSRITQAEKSICEMLGVNDLIGKSFLDVGSGSGLFSLAARRLGGKVYSFDFDPFSVACTRELRKHYFPGDKDWVIEEGSVLDAYYLEQLGNFDVVYSWGVLHHTSNMWKALGNMIPLTAPNGFLFIAIYNDQGWISRYWLNVKKIYIHSKLGRVLMIALHFPYLYLLRFLRKSLSRKSLERGMSLWFDMLDWLGGYPFEVAKPSVIVDFYRAHNFELIQKNIVVKVWDVMNFVL